MRKGIPIVVLLVLAGLILLAITRRAWERGATPSRSADQPGAARLADQPINDQHEAPTTGEGTRHAVAESVPTTSTAEPGFATAHLKVRTIGKTKRTPIVGASVGLWPVDDPAHPMTDESEKSAQSVFHRQLTTTTDGTVETDVPASLPIEIWAMVDDQSAGPVLADIPPLRTGEQHDIVLELPDANDARVFGMVLTADTHAPIRDARVSMTVSRRNFEEEEATVLEARITGADGTFQFDYPAWREPHLRIEATGYGVLLSEPLRECSDASRPLVLELSKSCTLRARVLDAEGGPLDTVLVDLVAEGTSLVPEEQQNRGDGRASLPDERWHARVGPDGWVTFSDLPPQAWLGVYLTASGRITRPIGRGVELTAGETKVVEWRVGGVCDLRGLVLDGAGKPVPGLRLWLAEVWSGGAPYFDSRGGPSIEDTCVTDDSGRFTLKGVSPGEWFLGPAPDDFGSGGANANSIAPVPERVVIGSERSKEITLHVERGLFVCGRVLDPDGRPCSEMQVIVDDESHHLVLIGSSDEKGQFSVGPFAKQTVLLTANGHGRFIDSPQVQARAGDSGVELRLRAGGWIRGRVVDAATGAGCSASILFTLESPGLPRGDREASGGSEENGNFISPACRAGSYSVSAITDDARWALLKGIDITVGTVHSDVLMQVKPGGKLRVRYVGNKSWVWPRIMLDGVPMTDCTGLSPGKTMTVAAPAGLLVLELRTRDNALACTREIELKAGETKEIALTDED